MKTLAIDLATVRVSAILNTASGSCDVEAEQVMRDLLADAGVKNATLWCGDAGHMEQAFKEAKALAPDILIVLGGDGTIRAGAEACSSEGPYLIPLPGGTMNMLPKALYGDRSWQEALRETLANPSVKSVSGGTVGGRQFFIAAIAGAPTLWAHAREALREGDIGAAIEKGVHAFQNMLAMTISYTFGTEHAGEAAAVAIICPLISEVMHDEERTLEACAISVENAGEVLGFWSTAAFGAWRDDANVTITKTRSITLSAAEHLPLILDGEAMDLGAEVTITFVPEAFKALVPVS